MSAKVWTVEDVLAVVDRLNAEHDEKVEAMREPLPGTDPGPPWSVEFYGGEIEMIRPSGLSYRRFVIKFWCRDVWDFENEEAESTDDLLDQLRREASDFARYVAPWVMPNEGIANEVDEHVEVEIEGETP